MWVVEQLGSVGAQLRAVSEATAPSRPGLGSFGSGPATRDSRPAAPSGRPGPRQILGSTELTRRELEVLRFLTDGDTNAMIARRLVVSVGTVKSHVKNILRKLGAQNRVQAAAYWFDLQSGKPPLGRSQRLHRH
jgi:DNA-binding NarL/FixJ family response regulator